MSMHDIEERSKSLETEVVAAVGRLDIARLEARRQQLSRAAQQPDFWSDTEKAKAVVKEQARLDGRVTPWLTLQQNVADVRELSGMAGDDDQSLCDNLRAQLDDLEATFDELKEDLKFSGPYDGHDVIMSIHAGAGGLDAQDWAAMLRRMYTRYAESQKWSVAMLDESLGDEGGIKSATLELSGPFCFGRLKGEAGVHRLVRLSPFNAESRETSFAKVEVMPKIDKPEEVVIDDKDLKIDVFRSGGHGGQSVNTTDSAVRITHVPTGIVVVIQNERSQLQNKEMAMTVLRSRLAQLQIEQHAAAVSELKGPNEQAAWGNQIRSYVLHPYKQVKDLRTRYETSDIDGVLNGDLHALINAYLEYSLGTDQNL